MNFLIVITKSIMLESEDWFEILYLLCWRGKNYYQEFPEIPENPTHALQKKFQEIPGNFLPWLLARSHVLSAESTETCQSHATIRVNLFGMRIPVQPLHIKRKWACAKLPISFKKKKGPLKVFEMTSTIKQKKMEKCMGFVSSKFWVLICKASDCHVK